MLKLYNPKRDETIEKLVENDIKNMTTEDIKDILLNGCCGYNNMSDRDLELTSKILL